MFGARINLARAPSAQPTRKLAMSLPLHPIVVHVPLALAVLLPAAGAAVLLAWRRGWLPGRTWVLVVAMQAALLGGGFLALQTGEADEERAERFVPNAALESHEQTGKIFLAAGALVFVLSLLPLIARRESLRQAAAGATIAGSLGVAFLAVRTGHGGGELVYRHQAAAAYAPPGTLPLARERAPKLQRSASGEHDTDDD